MTRQFVDHAGRRHRVEVSSEEIRDRALYWLGFSAISILFLVASTIAAGVL